MCRVLGGSCLMRIVVQRDAILDQNERPDVK